MTPAEQKQAAKEFVQRWQEAVGNEEQEARSFWIELCQDVLGLAEPTKNKLDFEKRVQGRKVDVFFEDMGILIENKSRGVDLDHKRDNGKKYGFETPYQQAHWYYSNMPKSIAPRWLVLMNFDTIRIHDLNNDNPATDYIEIQLAELPQQYQLLSFFTDNRNSRLVKEQELSIQAGEIVGRLYAALSQQYKNIETDEHEQKSLNVLIVRLVFLLYAEDADLLQERDAFLNYMRDVPTASMRNTLIDLFKVLDTKPEDRDPYLDEGLLAFPYINGGLFAQEDILIPQFTEGIRLDLIIEASQKFDWRDISPTIFGAVFESTLNPETRRSGGMHYTSIENIHKVIDPLFLDDLKQELSDIEGESVAKNRKYDLLGFQKKLATLNIFDPACGSGNFLTESYLELRRLENRIIENLQGEQMAIGFEGDADPIQVHISQFYGIEINDFAVSVAKTALWIAEEQAMEQTQEIMLKAFEFLPLKSNANIHEGNALHKDWNEVLPAERCSYIIGNPPFYGYTYQTQEQKDDVKEVFNDLEVSKKIDYVSCWYKKSLDYSVRNKTKIALVSTNSICQGEQVPDLWKGLLSLGAVIDFAYKPFIWCSEATTQAHVHVVIIGLHKGNLEGKARLFTENTVDYTDCINPYLCAAPVALITSRSKPISNVNPINKGSQPTDGGNLLIETEAEKKEILKNEPALEQYIRRYVGAEEFINNKYRWCFWLVDVPESVLQGSNELSKRIIAVKTMREASSKAATQKAAKTPALFTENRQPDSNYVLIPRVSSERRDYVPIGFMPSNIIVSDAAMAIPGATLYHFGVLTSQVHNAWMRVVAGRLKSDYRYSNKIVYNNFIWPEPTDEQRTAIEICAQAVLDARDKYPDKSLADLYDPDKMPGDLLAAHKELDAAVEAAYGVDFNGDEEKIVAHLFELYAAAVGDE